MKTAIGRLLLVLMIAALATSGGTSGQTVHLKRVMQTKLEHSQRLLGDLVTSNWSGLERDGEALKRLTADPAWAVLTSPEYVRHTNTFVRATEDLLDAARQHDLEGTPLAYVSLTLSCVQCHRYVARMRIAQQPCAGDCAGAGTRLSEQVPWREVAEAHGVKR